MGAVTTRPLSPGEARRAFRGRKLTASEASELTFEGRVWVELIEGELVFNEPKLIHVRLQGRLHLAISAWIQAAEGRGEVVLTTNVMIDEHNVYAPDLLWFSADHVPGEDADYPDRVPDLCVEIRSESTWRYDLGAKKRVYERCGLPELWLVDHASESVLVYRRSTPKAKTFDVELELPCGEALTSPQLRGFSLAVEELFAR